MGGLIMTFKHNFNFSLKAYFFCFSLLLATSSYGVQIIVEDELSETDTDEQGTIPVIARTINVHFSNTTEQSEDTHERAKTVYPPIERQDLSSQLCMEVDRPSSYPTVPEILSQYIYFYDIQNDNDAQDAMAAIKHLYKENTFVRKLYPYYIFLKPEAIGTDKNILEGRINEYIGKKINKLDKEIKKNEEDNDSEGDY